MSTQTMVSEQTESVEPSDSTEQTEAAEQRSQLVVQEVQTYIENHLPQYLKELSAICAIDSGTHNKLGVDEVALYFARRMRGLGMDITMFENAQWGHDVYGVMHGNGHGNVLLLGHIDTVYPVGTAAARPVRVEGDRVLGPGVYDMKGCVLSSIYAIEALVALNYDNFNEIRLLCVSDEEISMRHSKDIIRRACQGCQSVLVLEGARENGDLVTARKGGAWYKLSARGHSAHAGVEPEKGCNAILELAHQIVQFQSLHGWREGVTINVGRISGGTATNVVPDYAEVYIDLRFHLKEDRLAIEQRWFEMMQNKQVLGVDLALEVDSDNRDPMVCTSGNLMLAQRAQEIAQQLGFTVDHAATGGISDANYASDFGYPTLDGLGPIGGLDHSPREYLELSSVAPRAALLAGLMISADA
jgi:glutamate carboxypeptidase